MAMVHASTLKPRLPPPFDLPVTILDCGDEQAPTYRRTEVLPLPTNSREFMSKLR